MSAFACSNDVGSGGRRKWFLMDELSKFPVGKDSKAVTATQAVTNCRAFVATPNGMENEYYRLMADPESDLVKITLHWTQNESRNRGMYRIVDGLPQAVDPENNPLLPEYDPPTKEIQDRFLKLKRKGYTLEGKVRSPWYDKECLRPGANPQRIAQEYDLDFGGSVSRVYGEEFQQKARGMCRPPNVRGKFVFNSETLRGKFSEDKTGDVLLWTNLGVDRIPVKRQYALGADISWGTGSAFTNNSVVQVIDLVEMRQVCEFATTTMRPAQFADLCIAMAKWFHRGFLAWEIGGPGGEFTKRVLERGYENIYYRTVDETSTVGRHKKTKRVGWSPQKEEVRSGMFEGLLMGVLSDELQIHSHSLVEETGQYVYEGGKIIHSASQRSDDGADKGKSHGDRVVAMGVAYVAALDPLSNRPTDVKGEVQEDERPDTWAARDRYHEQLRRSKDDDWDARDNWELARGSSW